MKEFAQEGRTFDFVINDLTDIPISVTSYGKSCVALMSSVKLM